MKHMMKRIMSAALLVCSLVLFAAPLVYASPADDACAGIQAAGGECDASGSAGTDGFKSIIGTVINVLSILVGAVSVIMIIIGGFRYVVSNGDSNGVTGAKNTIMYAIVGLVVVLFAQVLVAFVFSKAQNAATGSGGAGTESQAPGTNGGTGTGTTSNGTGAQGTGGNSTGSSSSGTATGN
jgi:ABC-type Fe3+ transport system permease subunit